MIRKEWTAASANSPATRPTLRACSKDERSNRKVIARFRLRKYRIVNFVFGRVVARLRPWRAGLAGRRLSGRGESPVL
jgi:hypothetical protein